MRMTVSDPAVVQLIREVLAEELARLRGGVREERVRIESDADLAAFARRVLAIADDRRDREAFENGRLMFCLDGRGASTGAAGGTGTNASAMAAGGAGGIRRRGAREAAARADSSPLGASAHGGAGDTEVFEHGLLSERQVDRLPRRTARVRLGRRVKMTPLARDRLRRRGIAVDRED